MTFIKQNNPECYPVIRKIGCFFTSCANMAQTKSNRLITPQDLNDMWDWCINAGYIGKDNCVKDSAAIANVFLKQLGNTSGKFLEVGTFKNGSCNYYEWYKKNRPDLCRADTLIQKIKQGGPAGTHFRLVNKKGEVIEDPYSPPIKCLGVFYSILYAYVEDE